MEFRVLGPLELSTAGGTVPLTGPKRRALLARLLIGRGEPLPIERLVDELWEGDPPKSALRTLPTFVYQLRHRYGLGQLRTTPAGYVMDVEPEQLDAYRFEQAVAGASARISSAPADAMDELAESLALWRGAAYEEFASAVWARAEAARLEELRLEAVEAWATAGIASGDVTGLIGELEAWTTKQPLREPLWALRVIALARDGRSAEALRAVTALRSILRDELGIGPSAKVLALESAILRDEPLPLWPELGEFGIAPAPPPVLAPASAPLRRTSPLRTARSLSGPLSDAFVGRTEELRVLEEALDAAGSGLPRIVLLAGDAGIGKSRLLDEFTPRAVARGVQLLTGTCQADLGVPYLAIAAALRPLRHDALGALLAADTPLLGGDARLRLFLAMTQTLLEASSDRTTLLVIEDLHWIDDATLGLLRHLSAVMTEEAAHARARLMLVITCRYPDPLSPVAAFIERLDREQETARIDLGSLPELECRELIAEWLGSDTPRPLTERLMEASAGNPLVLRSAIRRLRDAGVPLDDAVLADALGRTDLDRELWYRVEQVGDACGEMLLDAAFLGDGTAIATLAAVSGTPLDDLDDLIDEAARHHILFADDEAYWFEHPQLRQLVYHWATPRDRVRRHRRIGEALAGNGADAVVVAHHLLRARTAVDTQRLLDVCDAAAERSARIGAWADAARYATAAFEAGQQLDLDENELVALEFRAGRSAVLARDRATGIPYLSDAAERSKAAGLLDIWGHSLMQLARERTPAAEPSAANRASVDALEEFLTAAGERVPALRAEVHALKAELDVDLGDFAAARRECRRAEDLALAIEDNHEVEVKVAFANGVLHLGAMEPRDAVATFERAERISRRLADPNPRIWCIVREGMMTYVAGDLATADDLLDEAIDASRRADNAAECAMAAALATAVAFGRGRFASAQHRRERAERCHRESEEQFTPDLLYPVLAAAGAIRSDRNLAYEALDLWDAVRPRRSRRIRPLVDALAGDPEGARRALVAEPFRPLATAHASVFLTGALAAQVELGALLDEARLADGCVSTLLDLYDRSVRFTVGWPAFLPRVLALGFAVVGSHEDADRWFRTALDDAERSGAPIEHGRAARDYAHFLEKNGRAGSSSTEALLRTARASLSESAISPVATTVSGREPWIASAVTRIMLVTDLVNSTQTNDALGDARYVELLRAHDALIRRRLAQHDGVEFKHTGDGIAAWFYSVHAALQCAVDLADDFTSRASGLHGDLSRVRIALAAGEPRVVGEDLFGLAVTVAFRVAALAQPGEVLVTPDVAGLARGSTWNFESRGRHALKGLRDDLEVLRVRPVVPAV